MRRHYPEALPVNYGAFPQTWEDPAAIDATTGLTGARPRGNGGAQRGLPCAHGAGAGDGDPLDVLDLSDDTCRVGEVREVRAAGARVCASAGRADGGVQVEVVGALALVDQGALDWKIFVAQRDGVTGRTRCAGDRCRWLHRPTELGACAAAGGVDERVAHTVRSFFVSYKAKAGEAVNAYAHGGRVLPKARGRLCAARRVLA
jgi:inorganic pyrophosphatase